MPAWLLRRSVRPTPEDRKGSALQETVRERLFVFRNRTFRALTIGRRGSNNVFLLIWELEAESEVALQP